LARLRALLRRDHLEAGVPRVRLAALDYDPCERHVRVRDRDLVVPRRELAILDALARRAGRVVTRERLIEEAYSFDDCYESNALKAQVSRLRRRLFDAGAGVAAPARSEYLMLEPASGHVVMATVNEAVLRLRVILDTLAGASRGMVSIRVRS